MKVSKKGIDLVKKWEGFYQNAYLCPANVWTIGWGTTKWNGSKSVKKGDKISREQAEPLLAQQLDEHASQIFKYVKVELNQNQYDALVSFHYNLGRHILSKDKTLVGYINSKQWDKVANQLLKYNRANGKVLKGLTNRRNDEVKLFLTPIKGVEKQVQFTNDTLKKTWEERKVSKATASLLDNAAVKVLGHTSKLKDGKLAEGDLAAISAELAVAYAKTLK